MFTPTVLAATITSFLAFAGGIITTWMTHRNRQDVKRVEAKVDPVSNGFSKAVLDSLAELKADVKEVRETQALIQTVLTQHLDDHDRARRRARRKTTALKGAA